MSESKQTAYILVGLIGSGKTSWAKMVAGTDFSNIRVSGDDIRGMIKDRYTYDVQLEPLVDEMKMSMIFEVLKNGKNVTIDDCHLTKKERRKLCDSIKSGFSWVNIIYVWMDCTPHRALQKRLQDLRGRSEFEWKHVMKKHLYLFEEPVLDENEFVSLINKVDNFDI